MGPDAYKMHIPAALVSAERLGIKLTWERTVAWAKELGADVNAFLIMSNDRRRLPLPDTMREGIYRCVSAGAALALNVWDLLIFERCYGRLEYYNMIIDSHPPARARLEHMLEFTRVGAS